MYIFQIDIDNFKSFYERTVIPFRKGFTTISGPNGSGKSNIVDSILFCLGLSSSRTMRAEKLSDLINNLSRRKECLVTITFRKESFDLVQETNEIPPDQLAIEVAPEQVVKAGTVEPHQLVDPDTGEVIPAHHLITVARRIKGNSSGYTSTYYLNGRTTTLSEIHDHLGRYNISPGCFNVMMQGDVAGFVNMSPVERRKIIDEIAGVAEFDRKIEQAQRELELTAQNIERNTILLNEIILRLEQLASERETALKYQKLRDEKHGWETKRLLSRYWDLKKSLEATRQNIAQGRNNKILAMEQVATVAAQIAQTRNELFSLSEAVKKKGEDQQIALKKQIEGLKGHVARKEDAIRFIDTQTNENNGVIEKLKRDIATHHETIETMNGEIAAFDHQLKELQALYDTEARAYEKLNRKMDAISDSSSELSAKRMETRGRMNEAENLLSSLKREHLDVETEMKRLEYDREFRLKGHSDYQERQSTLLERNDVLIKAFKDLELEKAAYETQIQKTQMNYSQLRASLNQTTTRVHELQREVVRLDTQRRAYEDAQFGRAVDMVLGANIDGVHGTLAQLGTVDADYTLAMEIAIGGRIQNVVVDTDRVAAQCIDFLKSRNGGRATFLPMNKIQRAKSLPALPRGPGIIDYAFNLIDFEVAYEDVFAYALGDTLIVSDMDAARPLLRQYRMVTVDGELLERSGAMTGGSSAKNSRGRFVNTQKLAEEAEAAMKQLEKADLEKDGLEKELTRVELKLETLKQEYTEVANRYTRTAAELEGVEVQLAELKSKVLGAVDTAEVDSQLFALQEAMAVKQNAVEEQEKLVQRLRDELDAIESKLPAEELAELRKEMDDVKFQMDHYDTQLRNVQADRQGKAMEKNYQEVGITEYEARIQSTLEKNAAIEKEKAEHFEEIKLTLTQIEALEKQTHELDDELKQLQQARDEVQNRLIEEEKQKNIYERQIAQLDEQIEAFETRKRELIPMVADVRAELLAQAQEGDADPDTVDPSDLPSHDEVEQNIARLEKRMTALEPVNMRAIAEYDEVEGRRNELGEKIDTLNTETETIQLKIASYESLKLESFREAFNHVDANFKTIFEELADGEAELVLSNPQSPFEGGMTLMARPRGKKMQRIEAMSGGEKSLTSLAFVFSLQRYLPAPFYALDEVDQNLDGINAEKLANMVKRESEKGAQFIVVSLRKPMIEHSNRTVGVTQKKGGITKVTGVKIREDVPLEDALTTESAEPEQLAS